jgi:hypothetical protein
VALPPEIANALAAQLAADFRSFGASILGWASPLTGERAENVHVMVEWCE